MKTLTTISAQRPAQIPAAPRSAPPLFPDGPDVAETASLWAMLPVIFAQITAMLFPERAARGAITRMWEMRKTLQHIYRAEARNYRTWLIRALRANPAWQAQVRSDLGGDAAMTRWNRRYGRTQTPAKDTAQDIAPKRMTAQPVQKPRGGLRRPVTDRNGLFRLAPVSRIINETPRLRVPRPHAPRFIGCSLRPIGPVPVTPKDLRSPAGLRASSDTARSNPNIPAPDRAQLARTWRGLRTRLFEWNVQLMLADIAISVPACRADLAPP